MYRTKGARKNLPQTGFFVRALVLCLLLLGGAIAFLAHSQVGVLAASGQTHDVSPMATPPTGVQVTVVSATPASAPAATDNADNGHGTSYTEDNTHDNADNADQSHENADNADQSHENADNVSDNTGDDDHVNNDARDNEEEDNTPDENHHINNNNNNSNDNASVNIHHEEQEHHQHHEQHHVYPAMPLTGSDPRH